MYSFGLVLLELLAYNNHDDFSDLKQSLKTSSLHWDPWIIALMEKCLKKPPGNRPTFEKIVAIFEKNMHHSA